MHGRLTFTNLPTKDQKAIFKNLTLENFLSRAITRDNKGNIAEVLSGGSDTYDIHLLFCLGSSHHFQGPSSRIKLREYTDV